MLCLQMVDNQKKLYNTIITELKESYELLGEEKKEISFNVYVSSFFNFRRSK